MNDSPSTTTQQQKESNNENVQTKKKRMKLLHYLQTNGYANSNKKAKKLIRDKRVVVNGSNASSCSMMVSGVMNDGQVEVLPAIDDCWNGNDGGTCSSTCRSDINLEHAGLEKETKPLTLSQGFGTCTRSRKEGEVGQQRQKEQQQQRTSQETSTPSFCIAFHKPCGMICTTASKESLMKQMGHTNTTTTSTTESFKTLSDVKLPNGFHPVGRLDRHSHGLLLFSTDGRLTSALLSPRTCIPRVYEIIVKGDVGSKGESRYQDIQKKVEDGVNTDYGFFQGTILDMERDVAKRGYVHQMCKDDSGAKRNDKYGLPPEEFAKSNKSSFSHTDNDLHDSQKEILSYVRVAVKEGKKRMVRRLFAALDLFVLDLKRIKYGDIDIGELTCGNWRYLDDKELQFCKDVIFTWDKDGAGWDKKESTK